MGPESSVGRGRRCERHELATGPDGLCALCRRESRPAPRQWGSWALGGVVLLTLLVTGGTLGYRWLTRQPIAEERTPDIGGERPLAVNDTVATSDIVASAAPVAERGAEPAPQSGESLPLEEAIPAPVAPNLEPPPAGASPKRPSDAELRAALGQTPVVMYATNWCGVCSRARKFLTENGLRYQEIDADKAPGGWEKVQALSGRRAVPVIVVDGVVIQGLSPKRVMDAVAGSMERRLGVTGIRFQLN